MKSLQHEGPLHFIGFIRTQPVVLRSPLRDRRVPCSIPDFILKFFVFVGPVHSKSDVVGQTPCRWCGAEPWRGVSDPQCIGLLNVKSHVRVRTPSCWCGA
ncbi:hypothetical protein AVEN_194270-1 [Araneus ventricosus]|uniref:Uncharacterized protein n=1 Tax=Araneus ventricosus TaxID=182803 RepID=A0A4Y2G1I4_ARAVE|nr:hypothetical protein AVEN_194270-1 [Araneus ventricosus]